MLCTTTPHSSAEFDLIVTALVVLAVVFGIPMLVSMWRARSMQSELRESRSSDTPMP